MSEVLKRKLKVLNENVWEYRASWPTILSWLGNFTGKTEDIETEHLHALHLLSQFMYFGSRETRALLRALFRDLYRYPIIEAIRRAHEDTTDRMFIQQRFCEELLQTRFLGLGNPAESGTHLLYYFRQENGLPKNLFINTHEIFKGFASPERQLRAPQVTRYVFLDDFCGSGQQAQEYSDEIVTEVKRLSPDAFIAYYVLFATTEALSTIKSNTQFDDVNSVYDLDPSFRCFSSESRYFSNDATVSKEIARAMCLHYGQQLWPEHPLGYRDGQFLIGFHHNTPDNTLPIMWFDEPDCAWDPIFRRYPKLTLM